MNYLLFSILFNLGLTFFYVIIKYNRPNYFKYNFIFLIAYLFLINFINLTNTNSIYLILSLPLLNYFAWVNLILILNNLLNNKLYPFIKNILIVDFLLLSFYTIVLFLIPTCYQFKYNNIIIFNIVNKYWYLNIIRFFIKINLFYITFYLLFSYRENSKSINIYKIQIIKWLKYFYFIMAFTATLYLLLIFESNYQYIFFVQKLIIVSISIILIFSIIDKPLSFNFVKFSFLNLTPFNKNSSFILNDENFYVPFINNHYYLNDDASLEKYCLKYNIEDKDEFSDVIIKNFNLTFNNLINKYRVDYFLELVKSKKYHNYSINALAQMSGFTSRHHLYKPFKKHHGGTPSDYIFFVLN